MKIDPYKRVSKLYDTLFEPLNKGLRAIGMKMFSPKEGMVVLDVGCGTGIHLERYQKAGCQVFGIDLFISLDPFSRFYLRRSSTFSFSEGGSARPPRYFARKASAAA